MKRAKSQSVIERNQVLLAQIKEIKTGHPLWGYRRIWSYLKYRQGIPVNKKRVYRLMKEQNLIVTPQTSGLRLNAALCVLNSMPSVPITSWVSI